VNDARAIRIEATAKARRILERGRARRIEVLEGLLSEANQAEVDAVHRAAKVLEQALESA
jgi:DNA-binding MarR family transcriptional regulator